MPAAKNNTYAVKHTKEQILEIVTDLYKGLVAHATKEVKKAVPKSNTKQAKKKTAPEKTPDLVTIEEKFIERVGYATLEEGLLTHGLYRQKLDHWLERFSGKGSVGDEDYIKEDQEVTHAIKEIKHLRETCVIANTGKGSIPTVFGLFLLKSQFGYVEKQHLLKIKSDEEIASKDRKIMKIGFVGGSRD